MHDKALCFLAQFDEETQNTLVGYYDIFKQNGLIGKQTKDIPYHFTLGSRSIDYEKQMIEELDSVCSEIACIDINLSYIGLFGLNVLFYAPNMNFELLTLQNKFFNDCGNGYHQWAAHVTLLMDEPEAIQKSLPIAFENFGKIKARIESVGLYEFSPARFIKECKLKNI